MKKILVVDNDSSMRSLLAMAFRQHQVETFLTDSVLEATEFLRSEACAGLLMDFHLGAGHSGAHVLGQWSASMDLPPFWLVTGTPQQVPLSSLQSLPGFQGVVAKPFSVLDLVAEVCCQAFVDASQEHETP